MDHTRFIFYLEAIADELKKKDEKYEFITKREVRLLKNILRFYMICLKRGNRWDRKNDYFRILRKIKGICYKGVYKEIRTIDEDIRELEKTLVKLKEKKKILVGNIKDKRAEAIELTEPKRKKGVKRKPWVPVKVYDQNELNLLIGFIKFLKVYGIFNVKELTESEMKQISKAYMDGKEITIETRKTLENIAKKLKMLEELKNQ